MNGDVYAFAICILFCRYDIVCLSVVSGFKLDIYGMSASSLLNWKQVVALLIIYIQIPVLWVCGHGQSK